MHCPNCGGQMVGVTLSVNPPRERIECINCGYHVRPALKGKTTDDISDYVHGEWDMFELTTSVWYGKQAYFLENNGIVYSRVSHKHLTVEQAYSEFLSQIGDDGQY